MSFIHHVKALYPEEACKNLIEWFNKNTQLQKKGSMGEGKENLNNLEISIHVKEPDDFYGLGSALLEGVDDFVSAYPYTVIYGGKWGLDPTMQLVKYKPNQFYSRLHCENDGHPHGLRRGFAFQIFLNTIESGGGTFFPYQKFVAEPKAGDFYMWPAGWTHLHKGIKAPKEDKYLITGWFNYEKHL